MELRYLIVPWIAPVTPAMVISVEYFRDLTSGDNPWPVWLAIVTVVALGAAIELGGGFMAKGLTDFWKNGSILRTTIAITGMVVYMYFGISLTWDTKLWPVFLFVTMIYLVAAAFSTAKAEEREEARKLDTELQIEKAKASRARAEARAASFSVSRSENGLKINEKVEAYLKNSNVPADEKIEDIAQGAGVSTGTAHEHKKRFLAVSQED